jgi:hypothetical protein
VIARLGKIESPDASDVTERRLNGIFETNLRQFDTNDAPDEFYRRFHFNRMTRATLGVLLAMQWKTPIQSY